MSNRSSGDNGGGGGGDTSLVTGKGLELAAESCKVLTPGTPPLPAQEVVSLLGAVPEWQLGADAKSITRTYSFSSYMEGVRFFAIAAALAESEDHHPEATIVWCKVTLTLWTHSVGGISRNDFILAAKFDRAWSDGTPV